ncbi:hypothetical protein O6H91_10G008700 [Diphasiastrum complanatum]|uniref:Uncharacterized protein n=1 Tax=Diphasiastrum complanatum TaxID=34168 RepID=A0ACC2CE81_DIPCM|nr:hypothetical protein O6H91_10G008700 [Diphasiastrum complanatum]
MVDCLLDFSFEEGFCNQLGKSIIFDGMQNEAHPAMFMKSLATARITRDGKYEAVMGTGFQVALEQGSEKPYTSMLLENCRRKLGKLSEKDDKRVFSSSCDMAAATTKTRILKLELGSILHLSFERAITIMSESLQERNVWALPPSSILATLLVNRLETPHEMSLTMEQYEEVLPKQVCAQRHIFLTECFSYNPLLFEILKIITEQGAIKDVISCAECICALLADSIFHWHSAFQTRRPPSFPQVCENEALNRIHVFELIQLVAATGWLPQPVVSCSEVISLIDGADVANLLLLVWRCMHHALVSGKRWHRSRSSKNINTSDYVEQADSLLEADAESQKEDTYTEWEGHLMAILHQNIAQIGAHFATIFPKLRAF